jgi:hypothetical protein
MRRTLVLAAIVLCLLSLMHLARAGSAQQAPTPVGQLGGPMSLTPQAQQNTPNPTPSEDATPDDNSLGPEGCTVAPLPLETAVALLRGTAVRVDDAGNASTPLAGASLEAVSTAFDVFVACVNGGDYLRSAAITTPEFFQQIVSGTGWDRSEVESNLGSLHPRDPEQYLQVLAHGPVLTPSENLATEIVQLLDPASPYFGHFEVGVTYELVNGQWLVADVTPVA